MSREKLNLKSPDRYKNSIGFTDMLFNMLLGFVFLFIIAFILINPITKKSDAPKKAEYLITMEWDDELNDDVDLWVRDPAGNVISFINRTGGLLNLEKDDLGRSNDAVVMPDGTVKVLNINREVVTVRGIVPGVYNVQAHIYARKSWREADKGGTITVKVIKVNPYGEVYTGTKKYNTKGQQITLLNFKLDKNGKFLGFNLEHVPGLITRRAAGNL
tara:strand:+ start:534 stop:1181 length:648 start_codon:yes stop_codon:yes gene_type:complete